MKKGLWLGMILGSMLLALTGCGDDQQDQPQQAAETVTVDFINQTGEDVGILRIRPTEEYDWSDNLLQEEVWKDNFEVPITVNGVLPDAGDGWQVQMLFLDGAEEIWQDVVLQDGTTATFSYANGLPAVNIESEADGE